MKRYFQFKNYLENLQTIKKEKTVPSYKKSSIRSYSRAISTISNEMFNNNLIECDIYMINDINIIHEILNLFSTIEWLKAKDTKGNRMYSNAIKRYIEYYNNIDNYNNDINFKKEVITFIDKPKVRPKIRQTNIIQRFSRDSAVSGSVIEKSGYLCEYNSEHMFFISKVTKENYVEAHHIVPLKSYLDFNNSLDVEANISSLCVVCHKTLHHGEIKDKISILEKLYSNRKDRLKSCNIYLTFEELLNYYK